MAAPIGLASVASARTAAGATCRAASPGASPRARARCRAPSAHRRRSSTFGASRAEDGLVAARARRRGPRRATATRSTRRCAARRLSRSRDRCRARTAARAARRPAAAEPAAEERDHAERRQVPLVEHDRVAQRDRPRCSTPPDRSDRRSPRTEPVAAIPVDDGLPVDGDEGGHELNLRMTPVSDAGFDAGHRLRCSRPSQTVEPVRRRSLRHAALGRAAFPFLDAARFRRVSPSRRGSPAACFPSRLARKRVHQINDFRLLRAV